MTSGHLHKFDDSDCLLSVITAQEAAHLWLLSRNAVSDACRRGALPARKSGHTWLITILDMLYYKNGSYIPDNIPDELQPAFKRAVAIVWGSD